MPTPQSHPASPRAPITGKQIIVGANECRIARQSERLIARDVVSDVVVAIRIPASGFAALLRFATPEQASVPRTELEALWDFADQALDMLFRNILAMNIPISSVNVAAIGAAEIPGITFGHGKQLALAVQRSLWRHGVVLNGNDLGGSNSRLVWLESASGRLIVRSNAHVSNETGEMLVQEARAS